MINETTGRASTASLFADALTHLSRLVETEIRLVKTEIGEKISMAVKAVATLIVAAVLLIAALILILQGVVEVLIYFGLQPFLASFIVGALVAIAGGLAIWIALRSLSVENLKPNRAINQIGKDALVIKDQVS